MRIEQVTVEQKRLSSAEAELWVLVRVDEAAESAALRGRLVGPKCSGIETVQIDYPLRTAKFEGDERRVLAAKIVIPEPNLWTPEQPFVYEGNIELWHEGRCVEIRAIRTAFKGPSEPGTAVRARP